ncbi:FAD-dependent oxidoreductase [Pseudonocardia sp. H11422]|uniref:FAD-dependent oxidoreductase n=1 Tax=Pseudonocardia sp. H11422 TaxID=2835866 RepID=UPI001BDCE0A1|nr:FAD-dependent oxidoreductase [Pseudonocardia sp. H11422]
MTPTITASQSLWLEALPDNRYPTPDAERGFDVLVLGGGVTGLTTALLLKRSGARVGVVEADRIGTGATGNNTAKVTALQSTMLSQIQRTRGADVAATYAERSLAGVEMVAKLAAEHGLDCDLRRRAAYTVAAEESELRTVEQEAVAARRAGLPVELTDEVDLPFPVAGAVTLADQVEFHPVKYAHGLAAAIDGDGCRVFEGTRALSVDEGRPIRVRTTHGQLTGEQVVVATHFPVWDRGLYFARMEATRAYCVAARVRGEPSRGMSITAGSPSWSFRSVGDLLIVCGQDHPVGARGVDQQRYTALEDYARQHWDVEEITHRWSAQDALPYDHTPMIGTYTPLSSRMFVAAGFSKWGLSGGTMAAMALTERITRSSAVTGVFSPHRVSLRGLPTLARMNTKVAADLVGDRLAPAQATSAAEVPPGEARVVRSGRDRIGVYRDEADGLHAVSVRCTHLGCLVRFNGAERSWDCPCHGSRFDVDGAVLEGPAVDPLPRREPPIGTAGAS